MLRSAYLTAAALLCAALAPAAHAAQFIEGYFAAARASTLAVNPATLDADRRLEREYLLSVIDKALFWQREAQWPYRNPAF